MPADDPVLLCSQLLQDLRLLLQLWQDSRQGCTCGLMPCIQHPLGALRQATGHAALWLLPTSLPGNTCCSIGAAFPCLVSQQQLLRRHSENRAHLNAGNDTMHRRMGFLTSKQLSEHLILQLLHSELQQTESSTIWQYIYSAAHTKYGLADILVDKHVHIHTLVPSSSSASRSICMAFLWPELWVFAFCSLAARIRPAWRPSQRAATYIHVFLDCHLSAGSKRSGVAYAPCRASHMTAQGMRYIKPARLTAHMSCFPWNIRGKSRWYK